MKLTVVLIIVFGSILQGCGYDTDKRPDDTGSAIDSEYLQSDPYRRFQEQAKQEQKRVEDERRAVRQLVGDMMEADLPRIRLPAKITVDDLDRWAKERSPVVIRSTQFRSTGLARNRFIPVGRVQDGSITLLLFMVKRVIPYTDMDVYAATVRDTVAVDLAMVASYKRTLSQTITPEITISGDWTITTRGPHISRYPIEYENNPVWKFRVGTGGQIREISQGL